MSTIDSSPYSLLLMVDDVLAVGDMGMGTYWELKILEGLISDVFSTIVLSRGKSLACRNEVFAISSWLQDICKASLKTLVKEAFVTPYLDDCIETDLLPLPSSV